MSEKESKFVDKNPENQKPHNISGKNPRSIQTLHKAQVKPRSQEKDITIEIVETKETAYKTKTNYLVQKAKMQLKRRVAPGISEIIVRKNEERRKKEEAEVKAKEEAEVKAKEEAKEKVSQEADSKPKADEKIEKEDKKTSQRKPLQKEEIIGDAVETAKEVVNGVKNKVEEVASGKSFTQTLREQGLIQGQKIVDVVEKAKPIVEEKIEETKVKVEEKIEETSIGKSFTQALREQGLIQTDIPTTQEKPKTEPKKEEVKTEAPKTETTTDGKSFTQTLREQGLIQTDIENTSSADSKVEDESSDNEENVKESSDNEENVKESSDNEENEKKSSGEAKTFIDLIREEGLL